MWKGHLRIGVRRVGRGGGRGGEGGCGRASSRCQAARCGGDRRVAGRDDWGMWGGVEREIVRGGEVRV